MKRQIYLELIGLIGNRNPICKLSKKHANESNDEHSPLNSIVFKYHFNRSKDNLDSRTNIKLPVYMLIWFLIN